MSGLPWFKLHVGLPDNHKVVALKGLISEPLADAYWTRLLNYCAAYAQTGRICGKAAAFTIEHAVRWPGQQGALVAAMLEVGLLERDGEDLVVHDWAKEQGAHVAKVERDRGKPRGKREGSREVPSNVPPMSRAESARNPRGESREKRVESREEEKEEAVGAAPPPAADSSPPPAPEGPGPEALQAAWNELTPEPIPRWKQMPEARRKAARAALERRPLEEWREVFRRIGASSFCRGVNDRQWLADPDWAMRSDGKKPETAALALEGKYDDRAGPAPPGRPVDVKRGAVRAEAMQHAQGVLGEVTDF
jgi:hypothetical protein